ncbi:type II toxin-antitoxin system RelE/ParE family toxin [Paraburkholderia pallida]|uniref:Type II toxin-antitoxin system RelE/ParE family toxin n=1 Tax=Paraburkholderia pallida TaxID=2547399 RepID=A0A4P7CVZ0_9BURK|nr:type II toxin-antitoxin system RelE/ParE family toxin [Paraburkholderia pallida]QBQ98926.1 type II toxin-antitoxin system RelE/ParE family toxin [Paraburkholderia pallida]
MNFRVRYTRGARDDLKRLYAFLLERDDTAAARALEAIRKATDLLQYFPFTCRKADDSNPFLRELVISFGDAGYVALFEIDGAPPAEDPLASAASPYVTIIAVRHQREDDYH